jgi:SAM-dependent methyltransferase
MMAGNAASSGSSLRSIYASSMLGRARNVIAPPGSRRDQAVERAQRFRARGDRVWCPCCGSSFAVFRDYNAPDRMCWTCGSLERDRSVWLYLDRHPELLRSDMTVVHVAPERRLGERLRQLPGVRYVGGDLLREFATERLDVTALPFDDESVDVVVCNHVLEHVPDDRKAMREIRRTLRPGGWALLLVPDVVGNDTTDEEPFIDDPDEQLRRFGQRDHVRRYGWDYVDRLTEAGFSVEVERPEMTLSRAEVERSRLEKLGEVEPLFVAHAG